MRHGGLIRTVEHRAGRSAGLRRLLCKAEAREGFLIRRIERQGAAAQQVERLSRILRAVRVGQRQPDGHAHIRHAELGQHGPVAELHKRMHDALPVDDDVDLRKRQAVQPHGLDDLKALVHKRRAVNGDLLAHFPVRVAQGVGLRHLPQLVRRLAEERPAGACQDQAADLAAVPAAHKTLKDGGVL